MNVNPEEKGNGEIYKNLTRKAPKGRRALFRVRPAPACCTGRVSGTGRLSGWYRRGCCSSRRVRDPLQAWSPTRGQT